MSQRASRMDTFFSYLEECDNESRDIFSRAEIALNDGNNFANIETGNDKLAMQYGEMKKRVQELQQTQALLRETLETRAKLTAALQDTRAKLKAVRATAAVSSSARIDHLIAEMEASLPAHGNIISSIEETREETERIIEILQTTNKSAEELRETIRFVRSALPLMVMPEEEHVKIG
ncbi:hypothetical protein M514_00169 [Trichuris suis]|uniref:Uncharacterized protein n=1 Tax=Trichuris suis TaxID=68888 RepID=A0A085NU92_9BILA|nr:hypothetical protein M513_00169 [Trichuris suis]KFD73038.1 hypothetical protein M514_00169 [Trichuris suis]